MPESAIRDTHEIRHRCDHKLRGAGVDEEVAPLLCFLLDQEWATPRIIELRWTANGFLLGRVQGGRKFKHFFGAEDEVIREIHRIAKAAELNEDELGYLLEKVAGVARGE